MNNNLIKDIVIISLSSAILFLLEQLMSFLPNIQLTVLLIFVYSKCFGMKKSLIIVLIHVLLDNLYNGSISMFYTPVMLIGWGIIPIFLNTLFKKINKTIYLALLGVLFSFIYCWLFIIPSVILTKVSFSAYMIGDIMFELLLAGSSFITILWLYEPLVKAINNINNKYNNKFIEGANNEI